MAESNNSDIQGLYDIIEDWWKSCYQYARGNIVDTITLAVGNKPLDVGEEMRIHFEEKTYIVKRIE